MKLASVLKLFRIASPLIKTVKTWIIADGKFQPKRAGVLLLFFVIILLAVNYTGAANTEIAIDLLDEISNIIGVTD